MDVVFLALGAAAIMGSVGFVAARAVRRRGRWALALIAPFFVLLWALAGGVQIALLLAGGVGEHALAEGGPLPFALVSALIGWWIGLASAPPRKHRETGLTRYLFSVE